MIALGYQCVDNGSNKELITLLSISFFNLVVNNNTNKHDKVMKVEKIDILYLASLSKLCVPQKKNVGGVRYILATD